MSRINICSLSRLPSVVEEARASHLVSLINADTPVARPASISRERHLFLGMNDIVEAMDGMVIPGEAHVRELIDFVERWERDQALVVHCWAGISRSTAAAFIAACALK